MKKILIETISSSSSKLLDSVKEHLEDTAFDIFGTSPDMPVENLKTMIGNCADRHAHAYVSRWVATLKDYLNARIPYCPQVGRMAPLEITEHDSVTRICEIKYPDAIDSLMDTIELFTGYPGTLLNYAPARELAVSSSAVNHYLSRLWDDVDGLLSSKNNLLPQYVCIFLPADYLLRALPTNTVIFPLLEEGDFELVGSVTRKSLLPELVKDVAMDDYYFYRQGDAYVCAADSPNFILEDDQSDDPIELFRIKEDVVASLKTLFSQ